MIRSATHNTSGLPLIGCSSFRGKPNEVSYLKHTAEYCAGLFKVSLEELTERTTANAKRFFGLPV